jgi:hypothetical protein
MAGFLRAIGSPGNWEDATAVRGPILRLQAGDDAEFLLWGGGPDGSRLTVVEESLSESGPQLMSPMRELRDSGLSLQPDYRLFSVLAASARGMQGKTWSVVHARVGNRLGPEFAKALHLTWYVPGQTTALVVTDTWMLEYEKDLDVRTTRLPNQALITLPRRGGATWPFRESVVVVSRFKTVSLSSQSVGPFTYFVYIFPQGTDVQGLLTEKLGEKALGHLVEFYGKELLGISGRASAAAEGVLGVLLIPKKLGATYIWDSSADDNGVGCKVNGITSGF